jgi:putative DNA primase/helicase
MMAGQRSNFRDEVVQELVARIEAGTAPWQKPWEPGQIETPPFNPTTGRTYRGINDLALSMKGYADPRWMTYRQAASIGAQVRKGEKASHIEYWEWSEHRPAVGEDGKPLLDAEGKRQYVEVALDRPRVYEAAVFNGSQIEGLEPFVAAAPTFDPIARAEAILSGSGVAMFEDRRDEAFYRIDTDEIHLPPRDRFANAAGFYATALHELGHATRHPTRLDRPNGPFGSEMYAREELRAEIVSYMLGRELGIGHDPSPHASYVGGWLKALKEDRNEIFRAARDAEIIKTWVMEPEQRQALEQAGQARAAAERSEEQAMTETPIARVYLTVPFAERGAVREAGARFDGEAKRWYVPEGKDPTAFAQWAEQPQQVPADRARAPSVDSKPATSPEQERSGKQRTAAEATPSAEPPKRIFLAVPYTERLEAKTLGAQWSKRDKSWWIAEGTDPAPFAKWVPGATAAKSEDVSPEKEFGDFLKSHGLVVDQLVMDGEWHRVPVEGEHGNQKSGSYVGFLADPNRENDRAAGLATNFKDGQGAHKWVATGAAMSAEQRADLAARMAQARAQRASDRRQAAEVAAKRAYGVWVNLPDGAKPQNCPYLAAKGVEAHGVKVGSDGHLVVPQRDADGRLWGVQFCSAEGKRYLKDNLHVGTMHVIERSGKGTLDAISPSMGGLIVIAEGYATAATIFEATGRPVVVAFDAGNLRSVAEAVKEKHPARELLIAADNDHANKLGNVGMTKAEEVAKAIGALWTAPKFDDAEKAKGLTDFNDLAASRGKQAVQQAIDAALNRGRGDELARGVA